MKYYKIHSKLQVLLFCQYLLCYMSLDTKQYNQGQLNSFINPSLRIPNDNNPYSLAIGSQGKIQSSPSYSYPGSRINSIAIGGKGVVQTLPSYTYDSYINSLSTTPRLIPNTPQISLENKTFLSNSVPLRTFEDQVQKLDIELIKKGMMESQEITQRLYKNLKLERQGCYCQNKVK